ncbi:hypothetical protein GCM10007939_19350 [Amylibacter marinus]|uniref:Uncharacterized protein n=1 Tax=Amylibacter marinus TaxID=1475483 RepID=A0ABQ5VW49_9RHOB|nr:hypothetical protein [Amylibacter marinus]GLQ35652.1 hypothetical protein GCM10007939_19350 [Amylibacter marinus]
MRILKIENVHVERPFAIAFLNISGHLPDATFQVEKYIIDVQELGVEIDFSIGQTSEDTAAGIKNLDEKIDLGPLDRQEYFYAIKCNGETVTTGMLDLR